MANIKGKIASLNGSCLTDKRSNTVEDIYGAMGEGTVFIIKSQTASGKDKFTLLYGSGFGYDTMSIGKHVVGFDTQNFRTTFDGMIADIVELKSDPANVIGMKNAAHIRGSFYVMK